MASVMDVAAYILEQAGDMTAMKLQKLCYYSQAWHLVWEEQPLFDEPIQAWANGPVVRALYDAHRGRFALTRDDLQTGDAQALSADEQASVDAVIDFYGKMGAHQLSELSHRERPWVRARRGLPAGARGNVEISHESMASYYDSLTVAATQG